MPQVKKKSFIQKNGLIAVWTMAGFMAMGYIGFLATTIDSPRTGGPVAGLDRPSLPPGAASSVQQEVAALRANVKELRQREKQLTRKLTNIEEALGPATASLPQNPQKASGSLSQKASRQTAGIAAVTPEKAVAASPVSINVLPLTAEDKVINLSGMNKVENYGVDLATARSVSALKQHWNRLQQQNGDLFRGLKPLYIDKGSSDLPLFSLVAGPFNGLSDAQSYCEKLARARIDCQETGYPGSFPQKIHTAGTDLPR